MRELYDCVNLKNSICSLHHTFLELVLAYILAEVANWPWSSGYVCNCKIGAFAQDDYTLNLKCSVGWALLPNHLSSPFPPHSESDLFTSTVDMSWMCSDFL